MVFILNKMAKESFTDQVTVGQKPEGGKGGGHMTWGRSVPEKKNYNGPKAWHVGATAKRPVWPEPKGRVVKDEVRAAGRGDTEDPMRPCRSL